ncbi:MAG: RNA polymerase sigma factor [Acidimicrobiales bacterium]
MDESRPPDGPTETGLLSDRDLVTRVAGGDRDAFTALYDRHTPWIVGRLSRRVADPGLVDEVVQDAFLALWRRAGSYRGEGEVPAWLWRIAMHRLVDVLRREGRPARLPPQTGPVAPVEERILLASEAGELAGAFLTLSPELRAVLQATVLDGLSVREASRLLGIPPGTVKSRAHRARAQLRGALA